MAVVGVIVGLVSPAHMLQSNFATGAVSGNVGAPLLAAVCATSFAYEGLDNRDLHQCRAQGRKSATCPRLLSSAG